MFFWSRVSFAVGFAKADREADPWLKILC